MKILVLSDEPDRCLGRTDGFGYGGAIGDGYGDGCGIGDGYGVGDGGGDGYGDGANYGWSDGTGGLKQDEDTSVNR